jgi:hypothetical protein
VEQQNADGFPSYCRHQFTLHRFFGHQSDPPTGAPLWRVAAHHGNDPLFLIGVQYFGRAGPLFLLERTMQAGLLIAGTEPADCLWGQRDHLGNLRSTGTLS